MNALAPERPESLDLDVLLIEDSMEDAELAIWRLTQGGFRCVYRVVKCEEELLEALKERLPSFILSDFSLPGFDGIAALTMASEVAPDVPFIFLSGTIGEERAIEALRRGAVDYVLKSNPIRLVPAVKRALAEAELRRANRMAERRVARVTGVLQMLSGINAAVVRMQDRRSLLNEACRLAHRLGGYSTAMISMIDPATRTARSVAAGGLQVDDTGREAFTIADSEAGDTSLIGRVIRSGESVFVDDLGGTTLPVFGREALMAVGIRSLACLPLRVDQTPVGAFSVGAVEAGLMGPDERQLLHEVAANLSFALQYLDKQDAVNFLNFFDPLTGLAKRALFCERLGRLILRGTERLPRCAVKVFDLDHLSVTNDSYGRHVGDRLLQSVADRLKAQCPDTERLAHLGGGTFVNVVPLGEGDGNLHELYRDVMRLFEQPFAIEGREITTTAKCGFALYPDNGRDPNQLVQNAEAALKEAKSSGEPYLSHRLEMNSALAARVKLEHRLRAALGNNQFELHYQPKLHLRTGKIEAAEALLRWRDPERGLVAPGTFLPILESAGLMPAIGSWALNQAASDCREWRRAGLPPVRVAVNISPTELRRRGFEHEVVLAVGTLAGGDTGWGIDIEVTEGALLGDSTACVQALRLMRNAGIRIAIDDFGTGYSSLARLSELPIDTLKIDRVFTRRLPADRRSGTLVATIIDLAHAFDMTTVAEGVETQGQLDYLARAGCDESQGFLHSRPIPRAEFEQLLVKNNTNAVPVAGFNAVGPA
jgi:diguanylate cyclase (GGDEF)-like protein